MGLFKKSSKAYGIFNMKCPRCHEGDLFEHSILEFTKPFEMPKHCPKCGQSYMPEPGFYYGAMFISYIITGWFCLAFVAFCIFVLDMSVNASFVFLIVVCAALFIWIFRISRSIWINMTIKYRADAIEKYRSKSEDLIAD